MGRLHIKGANNEPDLSDLEEFENQIPNTTLLYYKGRLGIRSVVHGLFGGHFEHLN